MLFISNQSLPAQLILNSSLCDAQLSIAVKDTLWMQLQALQNVSAAVSCLVHFINIHSRYSLYDLRIGEMTFPSVEQATRTKLVCKHVLHPIHTQSWVSCTCKIYFCWDLPLNGILKHPVPLGWIHISFYVSAEWANSGKKKILIHNEMKKKKIKHTWITN